MLLLPAILVVALALALILGGRFRNLAARRIRLWWLALVGLALQALPLPTFEGDAARIVPAAVLALSCGLIVAVAIANLREPGFLLIAIGFAMNLTVIAVNGGMPVSEGAARTAGASDTDIESLRGSGGKHHLASEEDALRPLGDVIGIPRPIGVAVSVGDVLAYTGAGVWLFVAMRRGPRREDWASGPREPGAKSSGTPPRRSSRHRTRSGW